GTVCSGNLLRVRMHGEVVAEIPSQVLALGGGAPVYVREAQEPAYLKTTRAFTPASLFQPKDLNEVLLTLLESPSIASKQWVYRQYDSTVRSNTVIQPGGDAAVLRIKGSRKGLAVKTDCNARYVYLNPRRGAAIAVAESARNVAITGARPVAITNCLNFGNPYKPENYWQFQEAIAGIGEACRALETPVTGGNVSFYNESPNAAVYPTPTIGMLGVLDDVTCAMTAHFKNTGDEIALLGTNLEEVGGSEYLKTIHHQIAGDCPQLDLARERAVQSACVEMIAARIVHSAHDVADGGLAVALAECCMMKEENVLGAEVALPKYERADFALFGESQSLVVISYAPADRESIQRICRQHGVPMHELGKVTPEKLCIDNLIELHAAKLHAAYFGAIAEIMA
ncbi:MAG: AIR synthase related protein, partial [candidate division KSB1 bacterium]